MRHVLAPLVLLAAPATAQSVLVVDETGAGGAFLDIQEAIDFASDTDLVLVKDGSYLGFTITAKALRVVADRGAAPRVLTQVTVEDLAPGQSVELHGLDVRIGQNGASVSVDDCAGPVLVQDCDLVPGATIPLATGIRATNASAVTVVRCLIDVDSAIAIFILPHAVGAFDSNVFVHDSTLIGGEGLPGDPFTATAGGVGTPALFLSGSSVATVTGTTLVGGRGGDGTLDGIFGLCADAGDGGPAVQLVANPTGDTPFLELSDSTLTPGGPGILFSSACNEGLAGTDTIVVDAGEVLQSDVFARGFHSSTVNRFGDLKTNLFTGQPFDFLFQAFSINPGNVFYVPDLHGPLYPGNPFKFRFRGFLNAAGEKTLSFTIGDTGFPFVPLYEQAILYNETEGFVASNPQLVLLLDSSIP